jgi:hypothetical protein
MSAFEALRVIRHVNRISRLGAQVEQKGFAAEVSSPSKALSMAFLGRYLFAAQPEIAALLLAVFAGEMIWTAIQGPPKSKDEQRYETMVKIYGPEKAIGKWQKEFLEREIHVDLIGRF